MKEKIANEYLETTYSDGSILKTVGTKPHAHRIFNKEKGLFTYLGDKETPIGTTTFNAKGGEVKLVSQR